MTPLISIILTSYNKPYTIGKAIESVFNQTYQNWELFIMDDNSNEETVKIIKQYINKPRIHYFNSNIQDGDRYKTTRYATLINEAIPKTRGKYLTYLTDDNSFLPSRFETMVKVLNQNSSIEIVYSQQLVKTINEYGRVEKETVRKTYGVLKNPVGFVDHCSIMHTRNLAERIFKDFGSYWNDDQVYWYNGDAAFWSRLTKYKPFHPIPEILDIAIKDDKSFQRLYTHLPKSIPNGTLVRGPSSETYIIENQVRRKISQEVFTKLKFDHGMIVKIPDPFLFKYKEGTPVDSQVFINFLLIPNQRLVKAQNHPAVYYLQNNYKHLIKNEKAFSDFNFRWDKIISVEEHLLAQLPDGLPIEELSVSTPVLPDGTLFKHENYYISLKNCLHPIEKQVAMKLKLPVTNPVKMDHSVLSKFKKGEPFEWKILF
ncbi:glycosyltransferase family 2 protein [Peribacillus sp. NPDC096448]|uniref:glycosyltransferase family 2 protein n=1 Tax=Peribacillus sp. NPDC096448 TaxID=3364395 RepID=UPI0037FADC2D